MIKIATLLAFLTLASCISYGTFAASTSACSDLFLKSCIPKFYSNVTSVGPQEIECATAYSQARVCFSNYKQCFPQTMDEMNTQMPVVCWNCYMNIDTDNLKYNKFSECLKSKSGKFLGFWLIALMLLVLYQ